MTSNNQFTNRPKFCDYLERYQAANKTRWKKSQYISQRVGIGRFDEWLKVTSYNLRDLDWQKLLELHRFIASQGVGPNGCAKGVQAAKHAIRWGIESGELPQKLEDIYTFRFLKNKWSHHLPPLSVEYLSSFEPTRPGSFRLHQYAHRVFHTFLTERKLTYRNLRQRHLMDFIKYLDQKGFSQQTKMSLPIKVKAYLVWLYAKRKIKIEAEELLPSRLMPKKPKNLPRPLSPELDQKLQNLLETTDDLYYKSILLIRRTGLRISELMKMEYDCIEYDQKKRAALKVPAVKLAIERRVPLDPKTIAIIESIQKMSLANHKKKSNPKHLVIRESGKPPRYERYSAALAEICARLNTEKWINLHSLRHTYATSMLNAGVSITTLKELLGHKTIIMTLLYAKVTSEKIHEDYSEAVKRMSGQQIPHLLTRPTDSPEEIFLELNRILAKRADLAKSPIEQKRIRSLRAKAAKLKSEVMRG